MGGRKKTEHLGKSALHQGTGQGKGVPYPAEIGGLRHIAHIEEGRKPWGQGKGQGAGTKEHVLRFVPEVESLQAEEQCFFSFVFVLGPLEADDPSYTERSQVIELCVFRPGTGPEDNGLHAVLLLEGQSRRQGLEGLAEDLALGAFGHHPARRTLHQPAPHRNPVKSRQETVAVIHRTAPELIRCCSGIPRRFALGDFVGGGRDGARANRRGKPEQCRMAGLT